MEAPARARAASPRGRRAAARLEARVRLGRRARALGTVAPLVGFLTDRSVLDDRPTLLDRRLDEPDARAGGRGPARRPICRPGRLAAEAPPRRSTAARPGVRARRPRPAAERASRRFSRATSSIAPWSSASSPSPRPRRPRPCGASSPAGRATEEVEDPQAATGPIVGADPPRRRPARRVRRRARARARSSSAARSCPRSRSARGPRQLSVGADRRARDRALGLMSTGAAVAPGGADRASRAVIGAIVFAVAVAAFSRDAPAAGHRRRPLADRRRDRPADHRVRPRAADHGPAGGTARGRDRPDVWR